MYLSDPCQHTISPDFNPLPERKYRRLGRGASEKGKNIQIIQPQQSNRIIDIKPERKRLNKVLPLLESARIARELRIPQLNSLILDIHPHLELQVFAERRVDFRPGGFDRGEAVRRDRDFAGFDVN